MIKKRIVYCWFGGNQKSENIEKCIVSWREKCSDYEIYEINESNFDVNKYKFSREAYKNKNWAFVSDVARADYLANNSGIYLDTDVLLLKSLDSVLDNKVFFVEEGTGFYASAVMGSNGDNQAMKDIAKEMCAGKFGPQVVTDYVYAHCLPYESTIIRTNNFTVYNDYTFINKYNSKHEETIFNHLGEHSWKNGWHSKNVHRYVKMNVCEAGNLVDNGKDITLYCDSYSEKLLFYANYFFSDKTLEVKGENFKITKNKDVKVKKKILHKGLEISYEGSGGF